jgi:hypothetical protein
MLMVKKQLDERIVDALTKHCTSLDTAAVQREAEDELSRVTAEADAADVASLSPLATAKDAHQLRAKAADLRFEADRLNAQVAALNARFTELRDAERRSAADAERAAAIAERDKLADDIAAQYPAIVWQMTDLVKRIVESDARLARSSVRETAESIARKCPPNFYAIGPISRLQDISLPMPCEPGWAAWQEAMDGWHWRGLTIDVPQRG